jgi:pimeloyl-ACP methyl ester carboxylesterase
VRTGWVTHEGARSLVNDHTPASDYGKLTCPALLLTGSASPLFARRVLSRLAEAAPLAHVETIDGAGHMGPLTHGNPVSELIAAHLTAARA